MTTAILEDLEKIASEHERSHPSSSPGHPQISLSGERAGFDSFRETTDLIEVKNQLFRSTDGQELDPNYSEMVLREYQKLQELYEASDQGDHNQYEIEQCQHRIVELEQLEGEQVEQLLTDRLHLPLGEEAKLQQSTEALLKKSGSASRDS